MGWGWMEKTVNGNVPYFTPNTPLQPEVEVLLVTTWMGVMRWLSTCKFQCTPLHLILFYHCIQRGIMDFSSFSWGKHDGGDETPVMTCGTEYSCVHIRFGSETFLSTACSHRCPVNPAKHLVDGQKGKEKHSNYLLHTKTWGRTDKHTDNTKLATTQDTTQPPNNAGGKNICYSFIFYTVCTTRAFSWVLTVCPALNSITATLQIFHCSVLIWNGLDVGSVQFGACRSNV